MTLRSCISIAAIIATLLTSGIAAAAVPVMAGHIMNCEERPDHEYCNGEMGLRGMIYCDLTGPSDYECYDRTHEEFRYKGHSQRPAINPEFDPF
jgi:hypothetical protein